ncbi:MAG: hypothetical protein B7Z20_07945, partial [Sphingobium sp. 32-64-5]
MSLSVEFHRIVALDCHKVVSEMITRIQGLILLLLLAALAACESRGEGGSAVQMTQQLSAPDSTLPIQSRDARIGPMDLIEISVFGAPDLDDTYQIDFEGNLKMPLIGSVQAAGYTAAALAETLEARLQEKYLQNADVTVRITEAR